MKYCELGVASGNIECFMEDRVFFPFLRRFIQAMVILIKATPTSPFAGFLPSQVGTDPSQVPVAEVPSQVNVSSPLM